MRVSVLPVFTALAFTALTLAGCGKSPGERMAEAAIEARTGQKVDIDSDKGEVKIRTDQGDMKISTGGDVGLPASFPKDIYLPGDYKVEAAMEMPNAVIAHLLVSGQAASIESDADQQMQAQGWKAGMTLMQGERGKIVMYEKDKRHATVTIATDPKGAGVRVGYQIATKQ